jgi:hypothetical protein
MLLIKLFLVAASLIGQSYIFREPADHAGAASHRGPDSAYLLGSPDSEFAPDSSSAQTDNTPTREASVFR